MPDDQLSRVAVDGREWRTLKPTHLVEETINGDGVNDVLKRFTDYTNVDCNIIASWDAYSTLRGRSARRKALPEPARAAQFRSPIVAV